MKIECCRCDKEIKKPKTNCYCEKCLDEIVKWNKLLVLEDTFEVCYKEAKRRRMLFQQKFYPNHPKRR